MATKQSFTADEWSTLVQAAMTAGIAVTAAEPSGLWGTLKEAFASASALARAKDSTTGSELVKSVIEELGTSEARSAVQAALKKRFEGAKAAEVAQRSVATLSEASAILDAKAPGEAAAYKSWLRAIAQKVAEASKEGGFLGFGGVQVSDKEKATLAEIDRALGTPGGAGISV